MRSLRRLTTCVLTLGVAVLFGGTLSATSSGAPETAEPHLRGDTNPPCDDGEVCVYGSTDYSGCDKSMANDQNNYGNIFYRDCGSVTLNNTIESVKNRGNCGIKLYSQTGTDGHWVKFNAGAFPPAQGATIQDPMLQNGGGASAGGGWSTSDDMSNRLASHDFCP